MAPIYGFLCPSFIKASNAVKGTLAIRLGCAYMYLLQGI